MLLVQNYFDQINDRPVRHMTQASRDLQQWVSPEEMDHINKTVTQLQAKWSVSHTFIFTLFGHLVSFKYA